jgi:hypothetical protein
MLGDRVVNAEFTFRLDELMLEMHNLFWSFPEQSVHDLSVMRNLEKCVHSARRVLSKAPPVAPKSERGRSRSNSRRQDERGRLSPTSPTRSHQEQWSPRSSQGQQSPASPRSPATPLPAYTPREFDTQSSFTDDPRMYSNASFTVPDHTTRDVAMNQETSQQSVESAIDPEILQDSFEYAIARFDAAEYTEAKPVLETILNKTEGVVDFSGREESLQMLLVIYCRLGKWAQLDQLLEWDFESRDKAMESLAVLLCSERKWEDVERILLYKFKGRENVMVRVARGYIGDKAWAEAKRTLAELMKFKAEESKDGLERMYILADVCWNKGDLDEARKWCLTAVQGKRSVLEKSHSLFFQFMTLLVQISDAQGNVLESEGYKALLNSSANGTSSVCRTNCRMC